MLDDIRRVAEEVGETPRILDYREHGNHSTATFGSRFGSWNEAVEAAGLTPNRLDAPRLSNADIARSVRACANAIGHPPRCRDLGGEWVGRRTVQRRFGSLDAGLQAAGLDPEQKPTEAGGPRATGPDHHRYIPNEELLADLRAGYEFLGYPPRSNDVDAFGEYSSAVYTRRFGSWGEALDAAGIPRPPHLQDGGEEA
nr:hypothetical protein [Halomarina oriensis]